MPLLAELLNRECSGQVRSGILLGQNRGPGSGHWQAHTSMKAAAAHVYRRQSSGQRPVTVTTAIAARPWAQGRRCPVTRSYYLDATAASALALPTAFRKPTYCRAMRFAAGRSGVMTEETRRTRRKPRTYSAGRRTGGDRSACGGTHPERARSGRRFKAAEGQVWVLRRA
jgi:hypothetical protein